MVDRQERLARMEQSSNARRVPRVTLGQKDANAKRVPFKGEKHTADQMIHFEAYTSSHPDVISGKRKPDDKFVLLIKNEVNNANLSRRDLYAFIGTGEGALFENENQAYNLEYGLRKRSTISLECAERWLAIIGKEMVITFQDVVREDF